MYVWSSELEYNINFTKGTISLYDGQEVSQHEFYMPESAIYDFKNDIEKYLINKGYKSYRIPISDKYRKKLEINTWALPEDYEKLKSTGMRSGVKVIIGQNFKDIENFQNEIFRKDVKSILEYKAQSPSIDHLPKSIQNNV